MQANWTYSRWNTDKTEWTEADHLALSSIMSPINIAGVFFKHSGLKPSSAGVFAIQFLRLKNPTSYVKENPHTVYKNPDSTKVAHIFPHCTIDPRKSQHTLSSQSLTSGSYWTSSSGEPKRVSSLAGGDLPRPWGQAPDACFNLMCLREDIHPLGKGVFFPPSNLSPSLTTRKLSFTGSVGLRMESEILLHLHSLSWLQNCFECKFITDALSLQWECDLWFWHRHLRGPALQLIWFYSGVEPMYLVEPTLIHHTEYKTCFH